eukprot:scaffold104044_cov24-Tisochrysis_lutea.AAC.3
MSPPCGQHCAFCEEAQAVSRTRLLDGIVFDVVDIHRASCNEAQKYKHLLDTGSQDGTAYNAVNVTSH